MSTSPLEPDEAGERAVEEELSDRGVSEKLDRLASVHRQVLLAYVDALERSSDLPAIPKDHIMWVAAKDDGSRARDEEQAAANDGRRDPFLWKFFIRLFTEAHIRRKLKALAGAYGLGEIRASANGEDTKAVWFKERREALLNMKNTLESWQRIKLLIGAISPIFLGLAVAQFDVTNIYEAIVQADLVRNLTAQNIPVLGFIVLYGVYLSLPVFRSFRYKREMFFPGVTYSEMSKSSGRKFRARLRTRGRRPKPPGRNLYELEDDLFDLLGRKKPRERRVDILGSLGVVWLFALLLFVVAWRLNAAPAADSDRAQFAPFFLGAAGGALWPIIHQTILTVGRVRRRKWR